MKLAVSEAKNEAKADASKKDAEIAKLAAEKESAVQLAMASTKNELQADVAKRDSEIASLQSKLKQKRRWSKACWSSNKELAAGGSIEEEWRNSHPPTKLEAKELEKNLP